MNHPRYEKIHLGCGCFMCTGRQRIGKDENIEQFRKKCLGVWWYEKHPEDVDKNYFEYKRKAENHIVYGYRKNKRRQVAKQIRSAYKINLKKSLDFGDGIVKISLGYTD